MQEVKELPKENWRKVVSTEARGEVLLWKEFPPMVENALEKTQI